ncbi:flagellar hook-associated protein FlgL [Planctomicrobium piriforme]|uniref:Flagellar hook-associated protein 3 n=1 Tax=Planctomicrobium piriforme TaxID=1576369 RepID=A0A1I3HKM9_9PLAN|nr:flagellar hook-associated protein FlgL [Planctomicrobium piriforme]SFI36286.1 flagellar hook-associated protein 3 [Planctomicrobium piriforme]
MSFRVTPHRTYELGQLNAQNRYAQGANLQQQISTGFRVNKPSDDPAAQKIILNQTAMIQRYKTQQSTIDTAKTTLSDAQTQVRDAQQLLVQAKQIALQARQATDQSEKTVFANQLNSILKQLDGIANAQSNGQYLFSGTQSSTPPFSGITDGAAVYQGSAAAGELNIGSSLTVKTFYSGKEVFQPASSGTLAITGQTGIANGTGTSSGNASTTLIVRHTLTTYAAGSGIQAGSGSVAGDTIIGAAGTHKLTIIDTSGNGSAGTVSLNGGPAVAFTSADTNLKVTGADGQIVYLNTQSITAGFNGDVNITADGTLSIDGGATEVPIDFSQDQILENASLGVVQHFDTTGVTLAGSVTAEPDATSDIFQSVAALRDAILNPGQLSGSDLDAAFERRLQDLDAASNHLLDVIGEQSVSLQSLDTLDARLQTLQLNSETTLNDAQSTDYATAITQLQEQQNLLQFTLQTLNTLSNISILDFLN